MSINELGAGAVVVSSTVVGSVSGSFSVSLADSDFFSLAFEASEVSDLSVFFESVAFSSFSELFFSSEVVFFVVRFCL